MKIVYTDQYDLNLGNHVFPSIKYRLIKEKLLRDQVLTPQDFVEPRAASEEDIALVHSRDYIHKLQAGKLSYTEILRLEIPYSPELVRAVWLASGGSILAGRLALKTEPRRMWAEDSTTPTRTTARAFACSTISPSAFDGFKRTRPSSAP